MVVFGDAQRRERPAEVLDRIRARLGQAERSRAGLARHHELVTALIEAGELAQGLADADFHAAGGREHGTPAADAAMALTMAIAGACAASWSTGFAAVGGPCEAALARFAERLPTGWIVLKQPEGYAHYLLYPEGYLEAARRCPPGRWQVIGVRSIGTSLACMVAAGLGAPVPISVRPAGHPFDRRICAGHEAIDRRAERYAVVDEGPGLSGSSVAAVVEWLRDAGIAEGRIHVFAGHAGGPGRHAGDRARQIWGGARAEGRVHAAGFDEVVLHAVDPARRLATWVSECIGPLRAPLRDIGQGGWRSLQRREGEPLAPIHPWQERRKFLAASAEGLFLVKFAGLGSVGERKLERARALAGAGFTPEPLGLRHGFLIEQWRDDSEPLPTRLAGALRTDFMDHLARYLAFRARHFPAPPQGGASIRELHAMARANTEEALGIDAAAAWDRWRPHLAELESQVVRVETDNRLHAWEWLVVCRTGAILKTDAVDHALGHDLVGGQDIAWDVAGASAEFALDGAEELALAASVEHRCGRSAPDALLRFLKPCYLAFQLGYYVEAEAAGADGAESRRLGDTSRRYRLLLGAAITSPSFRPAAIA